MKHLLIVYHSKTGNTRRLADAVYEGALHPDVGGVAVRRKRARDAGPDDLRWADGLLLGLPENFGHMAGGFTDFLCRTFYEVENELAPLPCAVFISAGNDGSGALRSLRRIVGGYPFTEVAAPLICRGEVTENALETAHTLGMTLAAGLEAGIF